ncbi:MAG: acyl-CoA thioester hydrolase/BAAT C-terminal domain-containing protein [Sphingomonas sp.]
MSISTSLLAVVLVALPVALSSPTMAQSAATAPTAPAASTAQADATIGITLRANGLVATWYPPASGKRAPAIIVLGGSEGGAASSKRIAAGLRETGAGALALAYFKADGLPPTFQEIPLDYFDRAIMWLKAQPLVDTRRLGLYGISKGGETALLVASRHPEFRAVVAAVPSSVVWQGFDPADYRSVKSGFVDAGVPVPYLPYDNGAAYTGPYDLYARSLAHIDAHPESRIPVERIGGALLLLSARDDKLWPSTIMADQVMARLDAHHFAHAHSHIAYADAGHGALAYRPAPGRDGAYENIGGTEAGNAAARADMWPRTLAFFRTQLKPGK